MNAPTTITNPSTRWLNTTLCPFIILTIVAGLTTLRGIDSALERVSAQRSTTTHSSSDSDAPGRVLMQDSNSDPLALVQGMVKMALFDLGIQRIMSRYELMRRQIILYLENPWSGSPLRSNSRLRAQTPLSSVTVREPLEIVVNE